ncbi:MAG TPA: ABC transporter substrate-binding protein [Burkholderiales bacterium]|nr:ABC transporter substrate-binding protein [Burkholderiales bacterium]
MRRRELLMAGAAALMIPSFARAQNRTPVIGLLWNDSVKPSPSVAVLLDALRERGWVAGRDFRVEDRVSLEGYGRYAEDAAELVRAEVDVIVAFGSTSVFAAAKATKKIPVVMIVGVDPVASGLVRSLSSPGGNVTGVLNTTLALNAKRIELLKELVPGLSSFGVVLASNVGNPTNVRDSEAAARALNMQVHFAQARGPDDIDAAISELAKARVGALYVAPSSMLQARSARVVEAVAKHGLPAVYGAEQYIEAGALMIYGGNFRKTVVRVASYVDRILKGARPGELAIEQISAMELVVNLKTARKLGITVPPSILVRADRVIE